jgi:hypothetical protein
MHTTHVNSDYVREDLHAGCFDFERLISSIAIDNTTGDDFELGEPLNGAFDTLDDDPE